MPSNFLFAVPHNLLMSLVLVFFQTLCVEIQRAALCYVLTDQEPGAGSTVYSLSKNIELEYSHVHK
jgi:hypothetical protein